MLRACRRTQRTSGALRQEGVPLGGPSGTSEVERERPSAAGTQALSDQQRCSVGAPHRRSGPYAQPMGERRPKRRSARGKTTTPRPGPTPAAPSGPEVHVTVATMPRSDITDSLAHDAALVKAALLYADRVTLASPNAIMMAGVAGLTVPDSQDRRDALMGMASVLPAGEDALALYEELKRRRKKLSGIERLALMRMEKVLKASG